MATPRTTRRPRHVVDTWYDAASDDPTILQIWAYTTRMSWRAGETLELCVSTNATTFDLELGRDGKEYVSLHRERDLAGQWHASPDDCSVIGCGWPVTWSFRIPEHWKPGGYLITLTVRDGQQEATYHHIVLIRAAASKPQAPVVLLAATGTWVAYNEWGGSNAYEGIAGPERNRFSPVLSTQRPWSRGFAWLPPGAPRAVPERPLPPGTAARYPYMEWAWSNGYSKKYASAGWASYERHMARWLEKEGYETDYATLHDLHADPHLLDGHRCVVLAGHDEYWSWKMRDAVESFVENGGHVARFAGNFLWQIRLEDETRSQICYKYVACDEDPVIGTADQRYATTFWEAPEIARPGAMTFGVNGSCGVYAGLGHCVGRGIGGFPIYRPEHWSFENAYLGYGDILGAESRIFGYEVDGLKHVIEDGLPHPCAGNGTPDGLEIVALGMACNVEADFGIEGEDLYIGSRDAQFMANAVYGDSSPRNIDRVARGNGMIVSFRRGHGEVYTAATCEWVNGLRLADMQVEQVTRNVLNRFTA